MTDTIKVGVIADQTGALAPLGGAQANTAVLVVDEINASGGVLGREIQLILEDSASDDAQAAAQAAKLVQDDHVEVILGGIFSSTRLAIKEPAVEGGTIYIYPEQYEGQEYDPLLFCTGAVPAQQVEPLIPWLMQRTGARRFYLPSADYIWPHVMNRKLHEVASANGGEIVGEQYYPIEHEDWAETVEQINARGTEVVFNTTVPPGCFSFLGALCGSGFTARGGLVVTTYFEENLLGALPPELCDGIYACMDYYQSVSDPFSRELLDRYNARFPQGPQFSGGSGATGIYRGLKLWQAAVTEAGSLETDAVLAALDHAKIADGPGGPAEMVPGQHHVRMNMYIARVRQGTLEVVESLGALDPKEHLQPVA